MEKLEKFFQTFESKKTVETYKYALKAFFESVYGPGDLNSQVEKYFVEERDHSEDVNKFFASIKERPPKTVALMLAAVKIFLMENGVELPGLFWRRLRGRKKGSRALTLDKVPSNAELRKVLNHMPIHGKALYLCLASSGMRIGEALKLQLNDIELDKDPPIIHIRGEYTKTGNNRVAFISHEASESLAEWLKVRDSYLGSASKKSSRYEKFTQDDRLFPFQNNTAYMIWTNALRKARFLEKDRATNRHTVHPHVLRKFFRTKLGSMIPVDVAEALMGHEGYLTEVYRRYSTEDLAKFYKQGEGALTIFTNAEEVSKLRVEVDEKNRQMQTIINGVVSENMALKAELKGLAESNEKLEDEVTNLQKEIKYIKPILVEMVNKYRALKEIAPEVWREVEERTGPKKSRVANPHLF